MSQKERPDILVFFSDQHNALCTGYGGDDVVRTPNLDRLARQGTAFDAAYTSCPLCVPARMSMLTGQLPSRTGIFFNSGVIAGDQATFLHALGAEGYETVLCGRMHFMGPDQRHGFTRRIMGEMTPLFWGRGGHRRTDLGPYVQTFSQARCLEVIGGGTSPVLEYDRQVVAAACEYLDRDHDRPQCLVVGTYGPHFSYVAPPHLYRYYRDHVQAPVTWERDPDYQHPVVRRRELTADRETAMRARAAYYGMVETIDSQVGQVREAWQDYLEHTGRPGCFLYVSDHGDQIGERNLYGKQTLFEGSARVPFVIEGDGIQTDARWTDPVSLMDVGPTLCELASAPLPPDQDGVSLHRLLQGSATDSGRAVISEFMDDMDDGPVPARMVRQGTMKLIRYHGYDDHDLLFDLARDPHELTNLSTALPRERERLRRLLVQGWDPERAVSMVRTHRRHTALLARWGEAVDVPEPERWKVPACCKGLPAE